jgi:hypothetical protein
VGQQALQVQQAKQELPEGQALQVLQDLLVQAQRVQLVSQEQMVLLVQQDLQVKVLLVLLE